MKTCAPPLPEFYEDFIDKDVKDQFEHALVMIAKAKPHSSSFYFYLKIINEYEQYLARKSFDDSEA